MERAQFLTDEFNKAYWKAAQSATPNDCGEAMLLARQLVVELGRTGVVHDKLLDPEFKNKYTLENNNG